MRQAESSSRLERLSYLFMICAVISLKGCVPDGPYENCPEERFTSEYKRYTMFGVGSYWIYRDSSENFFDSLVLTGQSLEFYPKCDYHGPPFEYLAQTYYSSFLGDLEGRGLPYWQDMVLVSETDTEVEVFFNDFSHGDIGGTYGQMKHEQSPDSLGINEVWYKDVLLISSLRDPRLKSYRARGVGVVRKWVADPLEPGSIRRFDLVRYNLKP